MSDFSNKRSLPVYRLLLALVLILAANNGFAKRNLLVPLDPRPAAADFSLLDLQGTSVSLQQFRGKVLVINFWATWCPPCLKEMPSLNEAAAWLKPHDVEVIAINVGESAKRVTKYLEKNPVDFKILIDPMMETSMAWQADRLPVTFIIDKEGRIAYRALGSREWNSPELLVPIRTLSKLE